MIFWISFEVLYLHFDHPPAIPYFKKTNGIAVSKLFLLDVILHICSIFPKVKYMQVEVYVYFGPVDFLSSFFYWCEKSYNCGSLSQQEKKISGSSRFESYLHANAKCQTILVIENFAAEI